MKNDFLSLLEEKRIIEKRLSSMVFGAPEIREKGENKYIYVNFREDGRKITNYVGEYSDELMAAIVSNTKKAKELKKRLREINKILLNKNIEEKKMNDDIKSAIDFAKMNLVTSINGQAVLEGIATTFAETEDIISGLKVRGIDDEDARKIVNLKRAWDFILNEFTITAKTDFALLCEINKIIEDGFLYNAGKIRSVPVRIGGTTWSPNIPIESQIKEELSDILSRHDSKTEIAISLLLYVMRKQIFLDGNKRTAVIFANHYLISNGVGVIFIDDQTTDEYKKLLIDFYETNNVSGIKHFLEKSVIKIK